MTDARYAFADCSLDLSRHTLRRAGQVVPVEPKVFDLLCLLVENAGDLVTRDRMIEVVWNGRIVSESAISACIAAARRAVGDDGKSQAIIRTIVRRGVQCVAEVASESAEPATAQKHLPPRIRFTLNREKKSLAYAVSGAGSPVIFTSFPGTDLEADWSSPFFRPLFDAVSVSNTLVRFDQIGTGQSDLDMESVGHVAIAEDMLSVADAAGLDRFGLFCQSGTVLAAVHLAAKYPDRVSRMVLNGGYAMGRNLRQDPSGTEQMMGMISEGWDKPDSSFLLAYALLYLPEGPLDLAKDIVEIMQRSCPAENMLRMRRVMNDVSVVDLLPDVRCPTLVIHSRNDSIHPLAQARILASGIPNAELLILESANHVPMPGSSDWANFMGATLDFLNAADDATLSSKLAQ